MSRLLDVLIVSLRHETPAKIHLFAEGSMEVMQESRSGVFLGSEGKEGGHKRIPQTKWLKQHEFICSPLWRLQVHNHDIIRVVSMRPLSLTCRWSPA